MHQEFAISPKNNKVSKESNEILFGFGEYEDKWLFKTLFLNNMKYLISWIFFAITNSGLIKYLATKLGMKSSCVIQLWDVVAKATAQLYNQR